MQRPLVIAVPLLVVVVIGFIYMLYGWSLTPPPGPVEPTDVTSTPDLTPAVSEVGGGSPVANVREVVVGSGDLLLDDPDIRAGLCGFKGRVVNHLKVPVADCGVRIYRGATDSMLKMSGDLFAERVAYEPDYIAGEVRTEEDGTFKMTGVWPRGMFMMFAGLDTDAPTHQIITKTPSPGQIIDLGDVVLNDAGVITGEVFDSEGDPVAGALVRAADIPGAIAAFFPAERFDPEGALLIREGGLPVDVIRMPPWVKNAFEHLPIPTTRSGTDGKFRLVGVMPGSNMLATTSKGRLSNVKSSVRVRPGEVKDVGRIRLREGEELYAKVLDEKGEPVAGAEVFAGSTLSMVPVDLATYLGETNEAGEIEGTGFSPGKVTVAARRSKNDAWVLAEPQSIISDVIVTIPAQFGFTVSVQLADGSPVKAPRFRLLRGKAGDGAAEMYMLGFVEPVSLEDRMSEVAEGQWRVSGLNQGVYTLLAELEGQATGSAVIKLEDSDGAAVIRLANPTLFSVLVVNQEEQPIRNAAIFAQPRGETVVDMPLNCGRTGKDGRLQIDKIRADKLRVSADHPRWGVVHGEAKLNEELVLRLEEPGVLHGVLSEDGKPPVPGKFSVTVMFMRGEGPRGPLESTPQMVTAGPDGTFKVTSLQPGKYWVGAMNSLDALRSPGGVMTMMQSMFMSSRTPSEQVEILSGQIATVRLEVGKKPIEGPTAQLSGVVMVDSRVAEGYMLSARMEGNRFSAVTDDRGRFDFGIISAGDVRVSVNAKQGGIMSTWGGNRIWSSEVKLPEGDQHYLNIDIVTSVISGVCYLPDGSPAANLQISARGVLAGSGAEGGRVRRQSTTKADGSFSIEQVAQGRWSLEFKGKSGEDRWVGKLENIEVSPATSPTGLRVAISAAVMIKGQADLSVLPKKPRWSYASFQKIDSVHARERGTSSGDTVRGDGRFAVEVPSPGRYQVTLYAPGKDGEGQEYDCGILDVPVAGLAGVKLTPRIK